MHRCVLLGCAAVTAAVALLARPAGAQTWSPHARYGTELGKAVAVDWGHSAASRSQFVDGNFRGKALVIRKISARARPIYYDENSGLGRTWQQVEIDIGAADLGRISTTYSTNFRGAPTQVYRGTMRWPNLAGVVSNPMALYPVQMPLQTPFVHAGNEDFAIDVAMSGGQFDPATTSGRRNYFLDTYQVRSSETGMKHYYHDPTTSGCVDGSLPSTTGRAFSEMVIARYADEPFLASHVRNRVFPQAVAENLPRKIPFLNVLALRGRPTGVPFGTGCERLYVDTSAFHLLRTGTTDLFGEASVAWSQTGFVFQPILTRLELFTQFAWQDTGSGDLKLTTGASSVVPDLGYTNEQATRRATIYGALGRPNGDLTWSSWFSPIFKYE